MSDERCKCYNDDIFEMCDYCKNKNFPSITEEYERLQVNLVRLMDENEQLKQQLEAYKESDKVLSDMLESRENDILKLKKQLEEAVEVIEFYGDKKNWNSLDDLIQFNTLDIINGDDIESRCGGKRARQFLAKYRGKK